MQMRPFKIYSTALTLILPLLLGGCGQKNPETLIDTAKQHQLQGDHKSAMVELKSTLQQQPNNGEARLLLGKSLLMTWKFQAAEKELRKAAELGAPADLLVPLKGRLLLALGEHKRVLDEISPLPTLSPGSLAAILAYRASAYFVLGKRTEAIQALSEAEKADPRRAEILLVKAQLAAQDRQYEQAVQWVDTALENDNKLSDAYLFKATLLEAGGKDDEALKAYQKVVANNDEVRVLAQLAISNLHLRSGNLDAADRAVREAEQVAQGAPSVRYARAIVELRRGKYKETNDALSQVLRVAPDHLPSLLAQAAASYSLGSYEQSLKSAERVLTAQPDQLLAAKLVGASRLRLGDAQAAIKTLQPWQASRPDDAELLSLLGEAYLQTRDYNRAMNYLDQAAALQPTNPGIKQRVARGYLAQGESVKALSALEQAVKLSDKAGEADLGLVMLHLNQARYDQALEAISALEKKLPDNPVTHNLRGGAYLGKKDIAAARKAFDRALALQPIFYPAALNLARLDISDNQPETARKRFQTILEKDPNHISAMLAMADLAAAAKQEKDYVGWLEKANKANPRSIQPIKSLTAYHLAKKDYRKALAIANEAATAYPDHPDALSLLGMAQLASGDSANALRNLGRLTEKAPQSPAAFHELAMAQLAEKQTHAARRSLQQAVQLNQDFIPALDDLIRIELSENRSDAALKIARDMQARQPESPLGYDREAEIHHVQKRYPQAAKAREQALARSPDMARFIKLHQSLVQAGETKDADLRMQGRLKQHPEDPLLQNYAAEVFMEAGRDREAIAQYEALLRIAPDKISALNNLALLYQRANDPRALALAEKTLKLAPDQPIVLDTLGWILVEQGRHAQGLNLLRKALDKAPKMAVVRYHHAVALARTGNRSAAKKELEAILSGGDKFPELEAARSMLKTL